MKKQKNLKGYTRAAFEQMNENEGLRLIHRFTPHKGMDAFIAEGRREGDGHMDEPHMLVAWAITKDEYVVEGRVIRIPLYVRMPNSGLEMPTERATRIEIAADDIKGWIKTNRKAGRF